MSHVLLFSRSLFCFKFQFWSLPLVLGRLSCRGFVSNLTHSHYKEITYELQVGMDVTGCCIMNVTVSSHMYVALPHCGRFTRDSHVISPAG